MGVHLPVLPNAYLSVGVAFRARIRPVRAFRGDLQDEVRHLELFPELVRRPNVLRGADDDHHVCRHRGAEVAFPRVALAVVQQQVADDVHVVTVLIIAVQGGAGVEDRPELRFVFGHGQPVGVRVVNGVGNDRHARHVIRPFLLTFGMMSARHAFYARIGPRTPDHAAHGRKYGKFPLLNASG